jgi:hypothetical protein
LGREDALLGRFQDLLGVARNRITLFSEDITEVVSVVGITHDRIRKA